MTKQEGDVVTPIKPTADAVAVMLRLDPKHEKVTAKDVQDITQWERWYDDIRVDGAGAVTSNQGGAWHTRFHQSEASPAPVRRAELLSPQAAIEKSELETWWRSDPVLAAGRPVTDVIAELSYYTTFANRRIPGTTGTNAMDFVSMAVKFELVYRVHPRDREMPVVFVDAYQGSILRRITGIVD